MHSHSSASDGTDPPAEVMRRAKAAGLDVIALTDHDTLAGHEEAREALPEGLTLVGGMEMSCKLGGRSVHMLAYRVDPANEPLAAECRAITSDRLRRGQAMVDRLRDLGADISWPHRARDGRGGRHRAPGAGLHSGMDRRGWPGPRGQVRAGPGPRHCADPGGGGSGGARPSRRAGPGGADPR
jgi:hypothetical protein